MGEQSLVKYKEPLRSLIERCVGAFHIWDLFPQNEQQVTRELKEIWLTEHVNNQ